MIPHTGDKDLSTDADSSTNTKRILLVRQNSPKKKNFFCAAILHILWAKVFPKDSENLEIMDIDFEKWGQKTFKQSEEMKKSIKKTFFVAAILHPLLANFFLIWDHYFSPQDSKKIFFLSFDIGLWEVGKKDR